MRGPSGIIASVTYLTNRPPYISHATPLRLARFLLVLLTEDTIEVIGVGLTGHFRRTLLITLPTARDAIADHISLTAPRYVITDSSHLQTLFHAHANTAPPHE